MARPVVDIPCGVFSWSGLLRRGTFPPVKRPIWKRPKITEAYGFGGVRHNRATTKDVAELGPTQSGQVPTVVPSSHNVEIGAVMCPLPCSQPGARVRAPTTCAISRATDGFSATTTIVTVLLQTVQRKQNFNHCLISCEGCLMTSRSTMAARLSSCVE